MTATIRAKAEERVAQALIHVREYLGFESRAAFTEWLAHPDRLGQDAPDDSTWGRWEDRNRRPPAWLLPALAEVAGLTYDQLLAGKTAPLPVGLLERLSYLENVVNEELPQLGSEMARLVTLVEQLQRRQRGRQSANSAPESASGS